MKIKISFVLLFMISLVSEDVLPGVAESMLQRLVEDIKHNKLRDFFFLSFTGFASFSGRVYLE